MDNYIQSLLSEIDQYRQLHANEIARPIEEYENIFKNRIAVDKDHNIFLINWAKVVDTFNGTLKNQRERNTNLSQVELAYILDVSPFTVSSWENDGKRKSQQKEDDDASAKDSITTKEKRSNNNKSLWQQGRRLPSIEQAYILSHVTSVGLNHYFLDADFEYRINTHNRSNYLLSLIEKDGVANKEVFFKQIAPSIEDYIKSEHKAIESQESIVSSSDVTYFQTHKGLEILSNDTTNKLQEHFVTILMCYFLKLFTNEAICNIYERMAQRRISFYFKNAFKILLREFTGEPYSGIDYKTNLTRLFAYIVEEDYQANYTKEEYEYLIAYFKHCSNFLQACDIIHFEAKQRAFFLENLTIRYNKLKQIYGSPSISELNYGKKEFLNKLGVNYNEDNLEERYEKAIELLSPIAKNMKFDNKE